jgi:hypothetical protein
MKSYIYIYIYGGYIQSVPQITRDKKMSNIMFIFDFNSYKSESVTAPIEYAAVGNSITVIDNKTILLISGSARSFSVYTSKPFVPSPCDLTSCKIQDSPEVSTIQWIQCEGACKQ